MEIFGLFSLDQYINSRFVILFCNLPLKEDEEGRGVCAYSNQHLVALISDFAGDLKNSVKVAYHKTGALLIKGKAFAHAEFKDWIYALAVDDALKNVGKGKEDYHRFLKLRPEEIKPEQNGIYGWLADESDFKLMTDKGVREFKNVPKILVKDILEKEETDRQRIEREHAEAKAHVDALEDVLKKQQAEMEQATRELEETMISHQKKREMLRQRRSQRQLELDAEIEKTQAQVATEEAEVNRLMDLIAAREVDNNEKMRALRNLHIAQEVYAKTKIEKDRFERQCQIEDVDFKELLRLSEMESKKAAESRAKYSKLLETSKVRRQKAMELKNLMSLKAEGLQLNDSECEVCYLEFTPVMTYEEQKALRLTHSKFEELNRKESTEERCWRNKALPCGHAKMCGACAQEWVKEAKRHGKEVLCTICRRPVEKFVVVRLTTQ